MVVPRKTRFSSVKVQGVYCLTYGLSMQACLSAGLDGIR